jgi:hypothetical protein
MENKKAWLRVSGELLRQALYLPDGTRFINARPSGEYSGVIDFLIESDELPDAPEEAKVPHCSVEMHRQEPIIFVRFRLDGEKH